MFFMPLLNLKEVTMTEAPIQPKESLRKASKIPYLIAIVVLTLIAMLAVMGILYLRPDDDNIGLITQVIAYISLMAGIVVTFMKSTQTDEMVNSSLSQWKADFAALQHIQGAEAGRVKEQERVAELEKTAAATKAAEALSAAALRPVAAVPVAPVAAAAPATEVGTVSAGTAKPDMAIKSDAMAVDAAGATINIVQPKK